MKKTPFKLKSGNTTPFKQMGSSPMKIDMTKVKGSATYVSEADRAKQQIASVMAPKIAETKTVKTPPPPKKSTTSTTSYSEAYKKADKSKYKTEAEFTTAAKAWNEGKYGTTEPTRESKKLIGKHEGDMTTSPKVTKGTAKKELAARHQTKKVETAKLEADKTRRTEDVTSGKAKIIKQEGGGTAVDYRKPTPKTKKRTKVGKAFTKVGNIFRKKGKKKNPHRKNVASTKSTSTQSSETKQQNISNTAKKDGTNLSDAARKLYA